MTALNSEREELSERAEYAYVPDELMLLNGMDALTELRLQLQLMRSELYSTYLAVVFTRNPALVISSQKLALLMIVFVQAV